MCLHEQFYSSNIPRQNRTKIARVSEVLNAQEPVSWDGVRLRSTRIGIILTQLYDKFTYAVAWNRLQYDSSQLVALLVWSPLCCNIDCPNQYGRSELVWLFAKKCPDIRIFTIILCIAMPSMDVSMEFEIYEISLIFSSFKKCHYN